VSRDRHPTTDNRQRFSRRTQWNAPLNRLTLARQSRHDLLDLTVSNPTRAGIEYPLDALGEALARGARATYDPDPRGLRSARETLAQHLGCPVDDLLLTASTSEAYAFLFKLLADPGDAILTATPSYPLLEHLAAMELVELHTFPLEWHRRWDLDRERVRHAITDRTRAIVAVHPNNPTGSFVREEEADALASFGLPLISDEVFLDYPLDSGGTSIVRDDVLTFTLGGLSKSAGLPHFKLGWIRVSGPGKAEALDALELIADNFLSVATPVQVALSELLPLGTIVRQRISQRTRENLDVLRRAIAAAPSAHVLPVEGGWSAVIRVPRVMSDEDLALVLLDRGVVVQPGYFFDFESDGYLVVSLLTERAIFDEGVRRLVDIIPA
jgi:aspartate/methionine/tyrosine aminotransferase